MLDNKPKLLILGGGFGGIETLRSLNRFRDEFDVTLISEFPFFTFTPFLHEILFTNKDTEDPKINLERVARKFGARFLPGKVKSIDLDQRSLDLESGDSLKYDYLVYALGGSTNFRGIGGAAQHSFGFKTRPDAIKLRAHLDTLLQQGNDTQTIIVGGGPTGIKLAAELSDHFKPHHCTHKVMLLEAGKDIGTTLDPRVLKFTKQQLHKRRVQVVTEAKINNVSSRKLHLVNQEIEADTIIWAAGIKPINKFKQTLKTDKSGRLLVEPDLTLKQHPEVTIIGDAAQINQEHLKYPQLAQAAAKQGTTVANNLIAKKHNSPTKDFVFKQDGSLISLGERTAAGIVFGTFISGFTAWLGWKLFYTFREAVWRR